MVLGWDGVSSASYFCCRCSYPIHLAQKMNQQVNEVPLNFTTMVSELQGVALKQTSTSRRMVSQSVAKCVAILVEGAPVENKATIQVKLTGKSSHEDTNKRNLNVATRTPSASLQPL